MATTVTTATLIDYAPEFASVDTGLLQAFIDEAAARVSEAQFGTKYDYAVRYLALHLLTVYFRAAAPTGGAPGSGGATAVGEVKWKMVGPLQEGRAAASSALGPNFTVRASQQMMSTAYGQSFVELRDEMAPGFRARVL